jgi:hypothetical protein
MGSACNYCGSKPREDRLVQLKCGHRICFACTSLKANFLHNQKAYLKCNNCNQ